MAHRTHADRILFLIVVALVVFGFIIFASASLGLLAREGISFGWVATKQLVFGIAFGFGALFVAARIDYRWWKRYALPLCILGVVASAAVFIPGIGVSHGGATRWIDIGITTFQPAELLKFGLVVYAAALFSSFRKRIHRFAYGPLPLLVLIGIAGALLALQPDFGTFLVIATTLVAMFVAAAGHWKHVGIVGGILGGAFGLIMFVYPYVYDRLLTFLDLSTDPLGSGYQISQSLIAIGSGEMFGRGFGQSIQKFAYLPEPTGDSIFAVAAEEFGFLGSVVLIGLFIAFAYRGISLAQRAPSRFGGLLVLGIVILIVSQSLINIASMIGLFPLTGMPLLFVSQGGTALLIALLEVGIVLNVSRHCRGT